MRFTSIMRRAIWSREGLVGRGAERMLSDALSSMMYLEEVSEWRGSAGRDWMCDVTKRLSCLFKALTLSTTTLITDTPQQLVKSNKFADDDLSNK